MKNSAGSLFVLDILFLFSFFFRIYKKEKVYFSFRKFILEEPICLSGSRLWLVKEDGDEHGDGS